MAILQGHPKTGEDFGENGGSQSARTTKLWQFLKKYKGGTKGNFSKISIYIFAQTTAPKVLEWSSYGNFRKVIQNPHFLKKRNGGTKENFSKIFQNVDLV